MAAGALVAAVLQLVAPAAFTAGGLDCRWTVNDRRGNLLSQFPAAIRGHLSSATVSIYPGASGGFVAHPVDLLAIRPYWDHASSSAEPLSSSRVAAAAECSAKNNTDAYEGYFHSLAAPTAGNCCDACSNDARCTFAAWAQESEGGGAPYGKCWLKNASTLTTRNSPGTVLLTVNGRPTPPPPPVLYWKDAWERNLATGPAAMASLVLSSLNGTQSGLIMVDYEPEFSNSWNFSTDFSTRSEPLWESLLATVHNQSLDTNWTDLVGWSVPVGATRWADLTQVQRLSLQERSWNFFCKQYFTTALRAIKAALPEKVMLSFWNWPNVSVGTSRRLLTVPAAAPRCLLLCPQ